MKIVNLIKGKFRYNFIINKIYNRKISLLSAVINCKLDKNVAVKRFSVLKNCTIDQFSYISNNCILNNCTIGKFCSIAPFVKIGFGCHPIDFISTSPVFYSKNNPIGICFNHFNEFKEYKNIGIGNDVWIGTGAIILDGVKIGNGVVIGAGAVVTRNVPDYAVVGGVPSKIIRYRFNENTIKQLVNEEWWNKDIDEINLLSLDRLIKNDKTIK